MQRVPVIVIGRSITALAVQRLVARLGHPVFTACSARAWATRTRHYRPMPEIDGERWTGTLDDSGYQYLQKLPWSRAIAIPAADDAAFWLSKLPDDIADRILVSGSSTETLLSLQNKRAFAALTDSLGVPSPRSFFVQKAEDLQDLPFGSGHRLFFKPFDSQSFSRRFDVKAVWVPSADEALARWESMQLESVGAIVQEYVPGPADQHYFIDGFRDRDGVVRAKLARQRSRIHPPDFGNSSLCKSIEFEIVESAWRNLDKLLEHVQYRGIFSAEFKRDSNSGEFKLLEVNTRPWVYIEFTGRCGVNMCELYIRDVLGLSFEGPQHYKVNKACIDLYADYCAIRDADRANRPGLAATLRTWCSSFKLVFSWSDPGPAMSFFLERGRSKLS